MTEEPGDEATRDHEATRRDDVTARADETKSGTFLVTAADESSAVLSAVGDGQVCPLESNPGFAVDEVVEATLEPVGPLGVTWQAVDVDDQWVPEIAVLDESPGEVAMEIAAGRAPGRLAQVSIDTGELHVLTVEAGRTDAAIADVFDDETTRRIAARLGAQRVEVRGAEGVVGVRYLI